MSAISANPVRIAIPGNDVPLWLLQGRAARFCCAACGTAVTQKLRQLHLTGVLDPNVENTMESLPVSCFWIATIERDDWWHSFRCGDVLLHPEGLDATGHCGDRSGCCGPSGQNGLNVSCSNWHPIATEQTDCMGEHVVILDRSKVRISYCADERYDGDGYRVFAFSAVDAQRIELRFCQWLYDVLDLNSWHDTDVAAILEAWSSCAAEPITVIWADPPRKARAWAYQLALAFEPYARSEPPARLIVFDASFVPTGHVIGRR